MLETLKVIDSDNVEIVSTQIVDRKIHLATLKSNLAHFQQKVIELEEKIQMLEEPKETIAK